VVVLLRRSALGLSSVQYPAHRGLDIRQRRDIGVVDPYQNEIRVTVAVRSGLGLNEL
jgi:hypothetical protein